MLSFAFTAEQEDYRRQLRRFAETELAPRYRERAAKAEFAWDAHRQLADLGVLGIGLPERYGGSGEDDPITLGMACEALAHGDVNVAAAPVQVGLVAAQIAHHGHPGAAEEWVPRLIAGDAVAAIAVTEPSCGSDAARLRTTARKVNGGYVLNGEKIGITHAMTGQIGIVYAREPGTDGSTGVSAFLVRLDADGVERSPTHAMGCLPLGWGGLSFTDVFVPDDHLVGEERRGFAGVMGHFDFSRPALGLMCLGAAQASIDEAVSWAQSREAFGRPLAAFQGVTFPIAEHATYLEAARWLCYKALWSRTAGEPHTHLAAMAKWWPPIVAKDSIETALITLGNLGYSDEMPLQQRLRDVSGYLIGDGTAGIQKRIIATTMFGRVAAS